MAQAREGTAGKQSPATSGKVKVLYISGWGRSGSTILGRLLGQVEDFFLVGELRYLWDRGLIENRLCSCGAPFTECSVWREITSRAFPAGEPAPRDMIESRERGVRNRHLLLYPTRRSLRSRVVGMEEYREALRRLYRASLEVGGYRVIVDTSKFPSYGYVLQNTPDIDLYVLHLVRDSRPVAHSWSSRRKTKPDHGQEEAGRRLMTPHGLFESSATWSQWNFSIERFLRSGRYMLLRYEDFVRNPYETTEGILRFLGEEKAEVPFVNEREVLLDAPHTFSGNPDRFRSGLVAIEPDEGWRVEMSSAQKAAVTALTWPGLARYGYPLLP